MSLKILPILLLFSLFACKSEEKKKEQNAASQAAILVEVIVAEKTPLAKKVKSIGNLMANESAELTTQVGGTVQELNFEEGTFVKKGRLLLTVFNADLVGELKEIQARKQLSKTQLERTKKLYEAEGISQEMVDQAQANFDELSASEQKLQAEIAKTKVYAPFDGIIGLRQLSKGDYLAANTPFANLVELSPIKIEFSLSEKYADLIKQGDSIAFKSPNNSKLQKALVYAVEPQIDPESRTIIARAKFHNSNQQLLPGAFVDVYYETEDFDNSIVVPNQSIIPDMEGSKVFIVKDGKVKSTDVKTGIRNADKIQILSGINAGDTLVTTGLMQIREGIEVRTRIDMAYQNSATE